VPTVLRLHCNIRVVIYLNDHDPPHIHVLAPDGEAIFDLNCPQGPLSLRERKIEQIREAARIKSVLAISLAHLCASWRKYHGRE
jgi:hypothetical protein